MSVGGWDHGFLRKPRRTSAYIEWRHRCLFRRQQKNTRASSTAMWLGASTHSVPKLAETERTVYTSIRMTVLCARSIKARVSTQDFTRKGFFALRFTRQRHRSRETVGECNDDGQTGLLSA